MKIEFCGNVFILHVFAKLSKLNGKVNPSIRPKLIESAHKSDLIKKRNFPFVSFFLLVLSQVSLMPPFLHEADSQQHQQKKQQKSENFRDWEITFIQFSLFSHIFPSFDHKSSPSTHSLLAHSTAHFLNGDCLYRY